MGDSAKMFFDYKNFDYNPMIICNSCFNHIDKKNQNYMMIHCNYFISLIFL